MNKWTGGLGSSRTPQQERGRRTQDRLLDAAEALIAENGADATSITDVAKRAKSSVGSLYHHFGDKSGLYDALFNRYAEASESVIADALAPERWEGARVGDILHGYVEVSLVTDAEHPAGKRAALELARIDAGASDRFDKLSASLDAGLRSLLMDRTTEIGHPDPVVAVHYVTHWLGAVLRARVEYRADHERHGPTGDQVYLTETIRAVCAYLRIDPPDDMPSEAETDPRRSK